MCGIVGYVGNEAALPIILNGLQKLEYRGYDSAGVALCENGKVEVTRALGKLSALRTALEEKGAKSEARIGLGHTRWATHGKPSEANAHPHTAGRVSLIHNGIIENYVELRAELTKQGCVFKSETDTEIAAHLLNVELEKGGSHIEAMREVCRRVRGSYAFLAIDAKQPDLILVAKNATPIVIGMGEGETIVASDIPAVIDRTRSIVVLEDGDLALIRKGEIHIERDGKPVQRKVNTITWDPVTAQKGGYKHYMLKEIYEQVVVLGEAMRGRVKLEAGEVDLPELKLNEKDIKGLKRIVLMACGTAWHACLVGKFLIEEFSGVPCDVDYASEFRYRDLTLDRDTLCIAVSQSGETADTLAAIEMAAQHCRTMAICNVVGSSVTRRVDDVIYTQAGPEISVASTKAFTTQLVALYLFAIWLGRRRGTTNAERERRLVSDLMHLPSAVDDALKHAPAIEAAAKKFARARDFLFLGRGACYPIALEGALKLKELSYIHAEGYPAGEMKHGPIALIDENMPVVIVLQRSSKLYEKTFSNLREVESRGGKIIAVTDAEKSDELEKVCDSVIYLSHLSTALSPILLTIPMQLLAYYVAVFNGTDVDLPRNLAKSVTVE